MQWSDEQNLALKRASEWFRNGDKQVYHLFGFAGTGKSTLAMNLASGIDGKVLFGAYT